MRPVVIAGIFLASCLEPTEVTIELTSDACSSLDDVEILLLEGDAPVAQTNVKCQGNRIGSLVFIPSQRADRFTVRVRAKGKSTGATCTGATTADCIQASRSIAYVPHEPLVVPIALDAACRDRSCFAGTTCYQGECVPADVSNLCRNGTCMPAPPDAGSCPHPWWNAPGPTALHWRFDAAPAIDDLGRCTQATFQSTPSLPGCGTGLMNNALGLSLGCANDSTASAMTFHLAFWVRGGMVTGQPLFVVQKVKSGTTTNGWAVLLKTNNELFFEGIVNGMAQGVTLAPSLSVDWHSAEIVVQAGTLAAAYVDQKKVPAMPVKIGDSATGNIIVGPLGTTAALDELYLY